MFYLTQRMKAEQPSDSVELPSINDLWRMDYMGSSEFEFGALPQSLKRVCKRLAEYETYTLNEWKQPDTDEAIRIFCLPENKDDVVEGIRNLLGAEYPDMQMKEHARFYSHFHGEVKGYSKIDAWWEIDYDFFFTIGKQNMKNIVKAIENTAIKHKIDWEL